MRTCAGEPVNEICQLGAFERFWYVWLAAGGERGIPICVESLTMKPKKPQDPTTASATASGPLAELVDNKLNKSLADQIAEELGEKPEEPARSGASDYARGTAEHEDDPEV